MKIDAAGIERAARGIDETLSLLERAQAIERPGWLGRSTAAREIGDLLAQAEHESTRAGTSLARGGIELSDAATAAMQLGTRLKEAGASRDLFDARRATQLLSASRDAAHQNWLLRSVMHLPEGQRSLLAADASASPEQLLQEVVTLIHKSDDQITLADMQRLAVIDQLPAGRRPALPQATNESRGWIAEQQLVPMRSGTARLAVDDLRRWYDVQQLLLDPSITTDSLYAEILAIVRRPDSEITHADISRLALIADLPDDVRPSLPARRTWDYRGLEQRGDLPSGDGNAREVFRFLRTSFEAQRVVDDPAMTKARLLHEVRGIIAIPDDRVTSANLDRLALILDLPAEHRPDVPSSLMLRDVGARFEGSRGALKELRFLGEVDELAHDPAVTQETLFAEILAIVSKPDAEITSSDIQRLARIHSLDHAKRPAWPEQNIHFQFRHFAELQLLPSTDEPLRWAIDALRHQFQTADILANPAVTSQSLTDELLSIAARQDADLTLSDMHRLTVLEQLDGDKRPLMPRNDTEPFGRAVRSRLLPATDPNTRSAMEDLRAWTATQSDDGLALTRERIARGEELGSRTVIALAAVDPVRLQAAGIDREMLLGRTLAALRADGDSGTWEMRGSLELARTLVDELAIEDPVMRSVRDQTSALLGLSIDRTTGLRSGGYGRYVDFAELGRAIAQGELLLSLRAEAANGARRGASTAETLAW